MYDTPTGYEDVAKSTDRAETIVLTLGINIDTTAMDDLDSMTAQGLPMSNLNQLVDSRYDLDSSMAVFEGDGIPTADGSGVIVPPISPTDAINTAYWSSGISDASGAIDFVITVALNQEHTSALTIYTDGPNILTGYIVFIHGNTSENVNLEGHLGYAVASGAHTYDSIEIHISSIDRPYHHVRITELEFGDSVTIGPTALANQVTYIDEIDPLTQGLPMRELDFDLINLNGEYDEDNPDTLYGRLAIGNPIMLSYTILNTNGQFTIPMGRFVIAEKNTNGNNLSVVSYDTRWGLSQMYNTWGISTSEDLGTTLDRLLDDVELAHIIDEDVYSIYPTSSHNFTAETTVLDDIQAVIQAYGLTFIPNRRGTVVISTDLTSDQYGDMLPEIQFSWPESSQLNRYNFIDIIYNNGSHYTRDLRSDPNTARNVYSISNNLITTESQAAAVCNRIAQRLYNRGTKVKWAGDPALDMYDEINVYSQWTLNHTPATFRIIKRQIVFNGMLVETDTLVDIPSPNE